MGLETIGYFIMFVGVIFLLMEEEIEAIHCILCITQTKKNEYFWTLIIHFQERSGMWIHAYGHNHYAASIFSSNTLWNISTNKIFLNADISAPVHANIHDNVLMSHIVKGNKVLIQVLETVYW